jgi:hypothetical protein
MYLGKPAPLATIKCAKADNPRNSATVKPTGVLNKTTGSPRSVPGGPAKYEAVTGIEKSFDKSKTKNICSRWNTPAIKLKVLSFVAF